jgi:hypothetical protein
MQGGSDQASRAEMGLGLDVAGGRYTDEKRVTCWDGAVDRKISIFGLDNVQFNYLLIWLANLSLRFLTTYRTRRELEQRRARQLGCSPAV